MQEEKPKDLHCFVCSLKFNEKVCNNLHLSLIHANRNEVICIEPKHKSMENVIKVEYSDIICEPELERSNQIVEKFDFGKDSLLIPKEKTMAQKCKDWREKQDQGILCQKAAERMRIRR